MGLDAATWYARRRDESTVEGAQLRARAGSISLARVVTAIAAIALTAAAYWGRLGRTGYFVALALALVFIVFVVVHDGVLERKRRAEAALAWAEEGLQRLDGRFAHDPRAGEPTSADDHHPYAADLDVLGRGSLLQSLDTTRTQAGRAINSHLLVAVAGCGEERAKALDRRGDQANLFVTFAHGGRSRIFAPLETPRRKFPR